METMSTSIQSDNDTFKLKNSLSLASSNSEHSGKESKFEFTLKKELIVKPKFYSEEIQNDE